MSTPRVYEGFGEPLEVMLSIIFPYRYHGHRVNSFNLISEYYKKLFPEAEIVLADDPNPSGFNRGRALNEGARAATGDIFMFVDADLWIEEKAFLEAFSILETDPLAFIIPFNNVFYLNRIFSNTIYSGKNTPKAAQSADCDFIWDRVSSGGCNVMKRSTFDLLGGFEPRLTSWGMEDAIFSMTYETLVGKSQTNLNFRAYHLWHPSARKVGNTEQRLGLELCQRYEAAYGDTEAIKKIIAERT